MFSVWYMPFGHVRLWFVTASFHVNHPKLALHGCTERLTWNSSTLPEKIAKFHYSSMSQMNHCRVDWFIHFWANTSTVREMIAIESVFQTYFPYIEQSVSVLNSSEIECFLHTKHSYYKWKRPSVDAPPAYMSYSFLPYWRYLMSWRHSTSNGWPWERSRTDRQTHRNAGPILLPRPLTREVKIISEVPLHPKNYEILICSVTCSAY